MKRFEGNLSPNLPDNSINHPDVYATDVIAERLGHSVVRLPIAHFELNRIELLWAQTKFYVARHNKTFKAGQWAANIEVVIIPMASNVFSCYPNLSNN